LVERIWNTAINHIELLYNEVIKLLESWIYIGNKRVLTA
jgi:hypothetical protein